MYGSVITYNNVLMYNSVVISNINSVLVHNNNNKCYIV